MLRKRGYEGGNEDRGVKKNLHGDERYTARCPPRASLNRAVGPTLPRDQCVDGFARHVDVEVAPQRQSPGL